MRRQDALIAGVSMVIALLASDPATAEPTKCRRVLVKENTKYLAAVGKVLDHCKRSVVKRHDPATLAACNPGALPNVAKAAQLLRTKIRQACGGDDRQCGVGGDDDPLSAIGWNIPQCLGFEGQCGGIAINDCGDIGDCLVCIGGLAAEQAVDGLLYDRFNDAYFHPNDDGIFARGNNRCEVAIAAAGLKFLKDKTKILLHCLDAKVAGKKGFNDAVPCPDTDPHVDVTIAKIAKAEHKKVRAICEACGSDDADLNGLCDSPGFALNRFALTPFSCPNVSVPPSAVDPGGLDCGTIAVTDLQSYIACIDCVLEFKAHCATASAVGSDPALGIAYPTQCN